MTPTVLFLSGFHFGPRDYDRLGAKELSNDLPVQILDCGAWVHPGSRAMQSEVPDRTEIDDRATLSRELDRIEGAAVAFDYLGDWSEAEEIRRDLKRRGIARIVYVSGVVPPPETPRLSVRLREAAHLPALGRKIAAKTRRLIGWNMAQAHQMDPPDIAVFSGLAGATAPLTRAATQIWAHTLDFETALRLGKPELPGRHYAVFLDEDMINHPDYSFCKLRPPTSSRRYYPALKNAFDTLKAQSGLDVVIAAHPRARHDIDLPPVGDVKIVAGRTAELIRNASLVLGHASTSLAFAVIWRKPVLLMTSQDLRNSWLGCHIDARIKRLGCATVNIDDVTASELAPERWNRINDVLYADYERQFIRTPGSLGQSLWPYLTKFLKNNGKVCGRTARHSTSAV